MFAPQAIFKIFPFRAGALSRTEQQLQRQSDCLVSARVVPSSLCYLTDNGQRVHSNGRFFVFLLFLCTFNVFLRS